MSPFFIYNYTSSSRHKFPPFVPFVPKYVPFDMNGYFVMRNAREATTHDYLEIYFQTRVAYSFFF